jgi:hypothetical protein
MRLTVRSLKTSLAHSGGIQIANEMFYAEKVKWLAEFGEEDGEIMAKYVHDAMPDYEYLLEQRVRGSK